ncbi:hypothetical protein BCF33_2167 [Hasllibacter halocynthiae]|uniref:Uncharacterized protein n=1 Tax=Hasllibacter halocynthiae TaxID=595589 RepID=A0A2T0X2Y6_9RHOB|nr:hypothetical protein [Hasllibacter halocynthiae]PRY93300.1 hypothetical protein BCF33_2167 [Hasllibacter halocynthiae]
MSALPSLAPPIHERQPMLVALLRIAALECRAAARLDLGRACAVLDPEAGVAELTALLARVLPQVLRTRPVIHPPGTGARSFDEDWLVALSKAVAAGDRASERFLLRRRCRPAGAAALASVIRALAEREGG